MARVRLCGSFSVLVALFLLPSLAGAADPTAPAAVPPVGTSPAPGTLAAATATDSKPDPSTAPKTSGLPGNAAGASAMGEAGIAGTTAAAPLSMVELARQRRLQRLRWEAALQQPARLTIVIGRPYTLGQMFADIQRQHGLSVQIDVDHTISMLGQAELARAFLDEQKRPDAQTATADPATAMDRDLRHWQGATFEAPPIPTDPLVPAAVTTPGLTTPPSALAPPASSPANPSDLAPPTESGVGPMPTAPPTSSPLVVPTGAMENSCSRAGCQGIAGISGKAVESARYELGSGRNLSQAYLLSSRLDPAALSRPDLTVDDALRLAIQSVYPHNKQMHAVLVESGFAGTTALPMSLTRAFDWEVLVQEEGVLLTTRVHANLQKVTRVYSLRELEQAAQLKPDDVARVITRSIRPWSWKRGFSEAAAISAIHPLRSSSPPTPPKTTERVTSPRPVTAEMIAKLAAPVAGPVLQLVDESSSSTNIKIEPQELSPEQWALLQQGLQGLFEGTVSAIQVLYHGDPPTATIEVLPGRLVITQSQGAHREIAELLDQLAHPE